MTQESPVSHSLPLAGAEPAPREMLQLRAQGLALLQEGSVGSVPPPFTSPEFGIVQLGLGIVAVPWFWGNFHPRWWQDPFGSWAAATPERAKILEPQSEPTLLPAWRCPSLKTCLVFPVLPGAESDRGRRCRCAGVFPFLQPRLRSQGCISKLCWHCWAGWGCARVPPASRAEQRRGLSDPPGAARELRGTWDKGTE